MCDWFFGSLPRISSTPTIVLSFKQISLFSFLKFFIAFFMIIWFHLVFVKGLLHDDFAASDVFLSVESTCNWPFFGCNFKALHDFLNAVAITFCPTIKTHFRFCVKTLYFSASKTNPLLHHSVPPKPFLRHFEWKLGTIFAHDWIISHFLLCDSMGIIFRQVKVGLPSFIA